jgi:hypothetical protein
MQILSKHESDKKITIALNLLKSEFDNTRIAALSLIADRLEYNQRKLEEFLDTYLSQRTYYYNIVTWLDRCLYSKGLYYNYYKSKLSRNIEAG